MKSLGITRYRYCTVKGALSNVSKEENAAVICLPQSKTSDFMSSRLLVGSSLVLSHLRFFFFLSVSD